jgi:hypothetical protein
MILFSHYGVIVNRIIQVVGENDAVDCLGQQISIETNANTALMLPTLGDGSPAENPKFSVCEHYHVRRDRHYVRLLGTSLTEVTGDRADVGSRGSRDLDTRHRRRAYVYGFILPMGARILTSCRSESRQAALPTWPRTGSQAIYNQYSRDASDPEHDPQEAERMLFFEPLFKTGFLIRFRREGWFGAQNLIMTSARRRNLNGAGERCQRTFRRASSLRNDVSW